MSTSIKNLFISSLRAIVVLGFVCSTFSCEDSVKPSTVIQKKTETKLVTDPKDDKNKPTLP